jgi:hypothetical protein
MSKVVAYQRGALFWVGSWIGFTKLFNIFLWAGVHFHLVITTFKDIFWHLGSYFFKGLQDNC